MLFDSDSYVFGLFLCHSQQTSFLSFFCWRMAATGDQGDDFWAIAISDYNASAENELDLKEGHYYSVIDTSDGGWWYALDEDCIDGWSPATYLERVDPQKNAQLQREYEERMKEEEERRRNTQLTYNNFDHLTSHLLPCSSIV